MSQLCITAFSSIFSINSGGVFTSYSTVQFLFAWEVWLAGLNNVIICNIIETSMPLE